MAGLGRSFDATAIDTTARDFENVPPGDYKLEVESSEVKPTAKGNGTILKITYRIIEPVEYENKKIFGNINLENENAQAQEIGQRELASLCRAVGLNTIEDSEELHFISFMAKVGVSKPRTGKDGTAYEPRNEIKRFWYPDEGNIPEAKAAPVPANDNAARANDNKPAQQQQAAQPAAAAAGGKARPWGRGK
jgi:hypothetical protein